MVGNCSAATAMLGLAGFELIAVSESDGEIEQAIQTSEDVVGCPGCGAVAAAHGRRVVRVRDLPAGGRAVTLVWVKRLWRCQHRECEVQTWTERTEQIRPRASLTERARRHACRRVGRDGHTVAQVAAEFGVGWATVMAAVVEYGTPAVNDPARLAGVTRLGVDETAFTAAGPHHSTTFATGVVDLSGTTAKLLDIVPGRSAKALRDWINGCPAGFAGQVQVAALDPFRGYAAALTDTLPQATRVLDCFHVTRLAFTAVDRVRRRVQQETTGRRGRRHDPLYGIRRLLLRRADHLSPHAWQRMLTALTLADVEQQIGRAFIAAQELRRVYQSVDRAQAAQRLYTWMVFCIDSDIPELRRLARTIDTWKPELLAYFDTGGVSNGPTEATNLLIKKIKRSGHGFRNFHNYRLRVLLHCGITWQDHNPTPLRGHTPRSAA